MKLAKLFFYDDGLLISPYPQRFSVLDPTPSSSLGYTMGYPHCSPPTLHSFLPFQPHPSTFVIPPPPPLPEPTISPLLLSHPATGPLSSSPSSSSSSSPTDSQNGEMMKVTPFNFFSALPIPTFGNTIDGYFMPYDASSLSRKRRRPYQTSLPPLSLHDDDMHHYPCQQQQQQRVLRSSSHQVVVPHASTSTPYQQAKVTSSRISSPAHCGLDALPSPISLPTSIPILPPPTMTTTTTRSRENEGDAAWTPKRSNSTTTSSSSSSISSMSMIKAKARVVNKTPPEDLPPALLPHFDALVNLFSRKRVNTQEYQRVLAPFSVPIQMNEMEMMEVDKRKKGGRGRKSRVVVVSSSSSSSSFPNDEDEDVDDEDTDDEEYVESTWRSSTRGSVRGRKKKPRPVAKTINGGSGSARRCLLCNHTLFHQGQMNQHIMDHFDIYPFRCYVDGCPGELKHERNLRRHIRSKHPYGRVSRARKMGLSTSSRRQPGAGTDGDDDDARDSLWSSIGKEVADEVAIVRDTDSVPTTESANREDE
ncbi:hypothetical protein FRC17_008181 [Serendipita sp. 399]|nr:hypothetical protein FRC17_008181 [Serendipita sp. 399]